MGDVALSLKYKLRDQGAKLPALVIGLETAFPTGNPDRGRGETGVEVQPFVAFLKQIHNVGVQGRVGTGIRHSGDQREYQTSYGGSLAFPVHPGGWAVLGEFTGSHSSSGENVFALSPGLHWPLGNSRRIGIGLPIVLTGAPHRIGAVLQFQTTVRRTRDEH